MSTVDPIIPQQKLMSLWSGKALDDRGILRVLNETGSKKPLFWIFNTAHEPEILARALGDDQPLIFSRSSHLIIQPGQDGWEVINVLTEYLYREMSRHFPRCHLDMGTSCQGSAFLMQLSVMLRGAGISVGHLCIINCSLPEVVTNLPALLIYGDQDQVHNPFSTNTLASESRAQVVFSEYKKVVLNARHGHFYSDDVLKIIIPQFDDFRSSDIKRRSISVENSSTEV